MLLLQDDAIDIDTILYTIYISMDDAATSDDYYGEILTTVCYIQTFIITAVSLFEVRL